jgi:hypothetical protein
MGFPDCDDTLFSPDNQVLATLRGDTVQLWQLPLRKPIGDLLGWLIALWLLAVVIVRVLMGRRVRASQAVDETQSSSND